MTISIDYGDVDWLLERLRQFRMEYQHIEREYLELRTLLRDAEAAFRADPENPDWPVKIRYLKKRLEVIETRHPWIASGKPPEVALWAPPGG
jgi:hypothetical protein